MANHDLAIGRNQDLSLRQDRYDVHMRHTEDLFLGHAYHSGFEHINDKDLRMGLTSDNVVWDNNINSEALVHDENQEENTAVHGSQTRGAEDNVQVFGRDVKQDDESRDDHDSHDDAFSVTTQNHDLGLLESNKLSIVETDDLSENLHLGVSQNLEMSIVSDSDMSLHNPSLVMDAPILQSRSLDLVANYELTVGREFSDVHACRRALRDAAIALRFEMQTIKSDKTRFTAKCASEGCPWRIHCAKLPGVPTFTIRTIHETHTCGGITHVGHQQASVQWVAETVAEHLKENPLCKPKEILEEIHRVHGITLSYKQAWRGKERIMATVRGSFEEDYCLLPQYCDQIRRTNPGSIASVYGNPVDGSFQRLFISFQASIFGFINACRPLIGLDKAVLKSKYLGMLLLATGFDGDSNVFPLAFGVIDEENESNWQWFLSELHHLLEINAENMPKLTILSTREKVIADAVESNFPTAFHGFCIHHLTECFRKEFNNSVLVNLLWEAAQCLTGLEFDSKIQEIAQISQEAALWVRNIPPTLWATAYFEGTRLGHLTANVVESLTHWIHDASGLPIIQMMECIRRQLMTCFNERRELSMQWTGILVPWAERQVLEAINQSQGYQVLRANDSEFEIITSEGNTVVDIRSRSCFCRGWQQRGLPCGHAVAALESCRQNVYRFAESCFTVANYRRAYSQTIHPIPDKALWNESLQEFVDTEASEPVVIRPPKSLRPPGRPRKRRARPEEEGSKAKRVVHCSRCNQTGHFRTTCTAPI